MIWHVLFIHCLIICAIFFAATGEGMALEEAKYTVIMKEESCELRQYEPHIIAETVVDNARATTNPSSFSSDLRTRPPSPFLFWTSKITS